MSYLVRGVTHLALLNYSATKPWKTTISIWDVSAREQRMERQFESRVKFVAFSPTAPVLAIYFKGDIYLWNWQTGEHIATMTRTNFPPFPPLHGMVFSADGRHLIVVPERPAIELWNVETLRFEGHFDGGVPETIWDIVISPDGAHIAMFERNSASVYVWDVGAQRLLWQKTSGNGRISSIVFSPDSQRLYVANQTSRLRKTGDEPWVGWDDHVRIWDINSAQQIDVLGSEFRGLEAVTLSPNEKIALLHYPDAVVLWDLEKRQLLRVWTDFLTWSSDIQLSPDGKKMVSMGSTFFASGTIKTWDVASQQLQHIIFAPEGEKFWTFAISPDNRNLAVVQDPWVQVRDLRTGKIKTQFPHRVGTSQRMAFSPSSRWIALGGRLERPLHFGHQKPKGTSENRAGRNPLLL